MAWTGGLSSLSLRNTGDLVPVLTLVFLLMTALLPFLMTTLSSSPLSFLLWFPLLPCLLLRSLLLSVARSRDWESPDLRTRSCKL